MESLLRAGAEEYRNPPEAYASTRHRAALFVAVYLAVTVLWFLFDRFFMSWERGDHNLPKWIYLAAGPFIALDNPAGFEIYLLASLIVVPIGISAVCADSLPKKLGRSFMGLAIWLGINNFFF